MTAETDSAGAQTKMQTTPMTLTSAMQISKESSRHCRFRGQTRWQWPWRRRESVKATSLARCAMLARRAHTDKAAVARCSYTDGHAPVCMSRVCDLCTPASCCPFPLPEVWSPMHRRNMHETDMTHAMFSTANHSV